MSQYKAWRNFDRLLVNPLQHLGIKVKMVEKIQIVPKKLVKRFGMTSPPLYTKGLLFYGFEDSNLDIFHVFDHLQTTKHCGPNLPQYYELDIPKHKRKYPKLEPNQFLTSDDPFEFRVIFYSQVYFSQNSDLASFKKWLTEELEKNIDKEKQILDKFGKLQTYDDYDAKYEVCVDHSVYKYNRFTH